MSTPIEDELKPRFDKRIYDLIEANPNVINWPFNVGPTRRARGENDVMGLVMTLRGWRASRRWGQPSDIIFNLGVRLGLFNRGLSYEDFIKAINDYRIRDMGRHEKEKSAGLFAALGAPRVWGSGFTERQVAQMSKARATGDRILAQIERDRAARTAAVAAANAQNASREVEGIEGRLGGGSLVQYRRHGRAHGIYSGQSPSPFTEMRRSKVRAGLLEEVVGSGNDQGRYVAKGRPIKNGKRGGRRRRRNTRRKKRRSTRRKSRRRRKTRRKKGFK